MSEGRAASTAAHRVGSGAGRLARSWRKLPRERRLAAYAAIGLFLTLFLPWYQETVFVANSKGKLQGVSQSLTGWAAFSFVEAAVLLVCLGVLTLLFQRAEGRAFHLPGGDGSVIMAAGVWACVLVIWRIFDKQGTSSHGQILNSSGIEWGIFVALAVAAFLAYAGSRIRVAHQPEPPLPGDDGPQGPGWSTPERRAPDSPTGTHDPPRPAAERSDSEPPTGELWASEPPARERHASEPLSPERRASEPPAAARRERVHPGPERPAGWLSAPRKEQVPADPPASSPSPARPARAPRPVAADEPPTARVDRRSARADPPSEPPIPPSTPAARREKTLEDELTIPLERED